MPTPHLLIITPVLTIHMVLAFRTARPALQAPISPVVVQGSVPVLAAASSATPADTPQTELLARSHASQGA